MILAAEYIPSLLQLMLTQKSDSLDSPVFPFFPFGKNGGCPDPRFPIGRESGSGYPPFPDWPGTGIGVPGAAGWGFPLHAKALSLLDTPINHLVDTSFSRTPFRGRL
jgi:hypothetical protein